MISNELSCTKFYLQYFLLLLLRSERKERKQRRDPDFDCRLSRCCYNNKRDAHAHALAIIINNISSVVLRVRRAKDCKHLRRKGRSLHGTHFTYLEQRRASHGKVSVKFSFPSSSSSSFLFLSAPRVPFNTYQRN